MREAFVAFDIYPDSDYTLCMTGKQLRAIRLRIGLTQAEFGERIRMAGNSVTRMENGRMIITPAMALLIGYVAREAGVESAHPKRSGGQAKAQRKVAGKPKRDSVRSHGPRTRKGSLPK